MNFFSRTTMILTFSFLFLQSCSSIDYISSIFSDNKGSFQDEDKTVGITNSEQLTGDVQSEQAENILKQAQDISENNQNNEDTNDIIIKDSDESLPASPTKEYESSLIVEDKSEKLSAPKEEINDMSEPIKQDAVSDSNNIEEFQKALNAPSLLLKNKLQYRVATLSFKTGSSSVDRIGLKKIKKIVELAKKRDAKVKIIGHASTRTKDMPVSQHKVVNFIISDKRAQSVAKAFIDFNFPKEKLLTEAVSDSKPLFKENMPAGTEANQRTEIFLIY